MSTIDGGHYQPRFRPSERRQRTDTSHEALVGVKCSLKRKRDGDPLLPLVI